MHKSKKNCKQQNRHFIKSVHEILTHELYSQYIFVTYHNVSKLIKDQN